MSSQICLKWNSFLSNIATSFESLWEEEGLVDVTLASDGQCLTAHKVILSASSPFFKKVFQTNPCQHPVIILQDVRFSELEALLIFIYKGEVNIEQKNLPALLKAAETLQIRGLSGGDIFAKESYKRLIKLEQSITEEEDAVLVQDETPKKKHKVGKTQNNSILEKALTPRVTRSASASESSNSDAFSKETEGQLQDGDTVPNPVYHRLEMKIEPFEVTVEDLQKHTEDKTPLHRLDTGQTDGTQVNQTIAGPSKPSVTVIAEAHHISSPHDRETVTENQDSTTEKSHKTVESAVIENRCSPIPSEMETIEMEARSDYPESTAFPPLDSDSVITNPTFPSFTNPSNSTFSEESHAATTTTKGGPVYPPFPCPFCDRAYTSWGFRRRHIKAVHTISPKLNCKWCLQVLPTHAAWRWHVISAHNLSASDAHNGLLILEEAHMVLQIAHPTRLDTLVNIIKQRSHIEQNSTTRDSDPQTD